jgi:hypothetical protein|tara:strand:+ start:16 stop:246 length:231 start_codon:yes stop_codon:yes gene_type:complete
MSRENIRHEGLWRVKIVRHYEAIVEVDAESKFEAERYARQDENQNIANHNEDYFFRFDDIEHSHEATLHESYEGDE